MTAVVEVSGRTFVTPRRPQDDDKIPAIDISIIFLKYFPAALSRTSFPLESHSPMASKGWSQSQEKVVGAYAWSRRSKVGYLTLHRLLDAEGGNPAGIVRGVPVLCRVGQTRALQR